MKEVELELDFLHLSFSPPAAPLPPPDNLKRGNKFRYASVFPQLEARMAGPPVALAGAGHRSRVFAGAWRAPRVGPRPSRHYHVSHSGARASDAKAVRE